MDLQEFVTKYPEEKTCKEKFKELRDNKGLLCPKCGFDDHYWLSTREQYKCKNCGHRIPMKSGTLLHSSKLPFRYWFIAAQLVISSTRFSTVELQKMLGHKYYSPVWIMLDKVKKSLVYYENYYKRKISSANELLLLPPVKENELERISEKSKFLNDDVLIEELEYQYFI